MDLYFIYENHLLEEMCYIRIDDLKEIHKHTVILCWILFEANDEPKPSGAEEEFAYSQFLDLRPECVLK